jgi:hypothetical protein
MSSHLGHDDDVVLLFFLLLLPFCDSNDNVSIVVDEKQDFLSMGT